MSYYQQKVCNKILQEYFGDIVAKVGQVLFQRGRNPLRVICANARLAPTKVSQALAVLIQHNLVVWEEWRRGIPAYTLLHDRVLLILRFPRYVYLVREQFGEEAEMVVDVLLKEGQATASHVIVTSSLKLIEAAENAPTPALTSESFDQRHISQRNQLQRLIEAQFVQRCPTPQNADQAVPVLSIKGDLLYSFPNDLLDLKALQQDIQLRATNTTTSTTTSAAATTQPKVTHPDANVFWRLNYDRFHIEFRDSEICNSISRRVDPLAGECLSAMLKISYLKSDPWDASLNPVSLAEVREQLKDLKHLDQYLRILEEETGGCVRRIGDAGGGQFRVELGEAYRNLTHTLIYQIVEERLGSKAARIFRLIHKNGMMEQDQVADLAMISKKDANLITFRLTQDHLILIHEVRKTLAPSPANKITYLFHIDMEAVVRMCLDWTYRTIYNLMVQREMTQSDNSRLLDKRMRVDSIVENLRQSGGTEEQVREVEEMMTPAEVQQVEKVSSTQDRLFDAEIGLDETIFVLQMFLYYQRQHD
ncbi:DNA-directed RNA polymerase III subunit RPC3-like [Portunus trituberculatus]|uniref:DNA-directed RNA polymerase III subunit RPC3-like n=1 Tax=Portunus trituberculatus TaxID=210409 RepID=UPI001E1CE8C8|nr:DNA-directed RNA polymerase III subunit RPC3-like [Portunus trituberculatus]